MWLVSPGTPTDSPEAFSLARAPSSESIQNS